MMRRLLKKSAFPLLPQLVMTFVLAVVLCSLIYGSKSDEHNLGSYMLWYLWWASLPFVFLIVGRMWCGICPVGFLTDITCKLFPKRPFGWPHILVEYEISIIAGSLLAVHFLNLWFNFEENIHAGGMLIAFMISIAILVACLFQKRIWCRTLCPLGSFASMMSGLALLRLQVNKSSCVKRCRGSACSVSGQSSSRCPMAINISHGIDPRFCSLCGNCLKDCPKNSIDVSWQLRPELSLFASTQSSLAALLFLGVSWDMCFYHLMDRPIYLWQFTQMLNINPGGWFEMMLHVLIVVLPASLLAAFAWFGSRPLGVFADAFVVFARPALPMAALVVAAIAVRPLVIAGPMNLKEILLSAGYQQFSWLDNVRFLEGWPLEIIEHLLVSIGVIWAVYEIRRIIIASTGQEKLNWWWKMSAVFACVTYLFFGLSCYWMFHQPMMT